MSTNHYAVAVICLGIGYMAGVIHEYHRNDRKKCSNTFLVVMLITFASLFFTKSL